MDYRAYVPGDDIRAVDWKVYARTDKLVIKRYEEERSLTLHIVLDQSASMNFGKKGSKFEYGAMLGLGFAYLAMKENERFEFSTFGDELRVYKARRGMHQLANMVNYLDTVKVKGNTKFSDMMAQYKKLIKTRSIIVVISDFLFDLEEIKQGLISLGRLGKHEIKVIQVLDPVETELNIEGDVQLKDSESGEVLKTHISPRLRQHYKVQLNEHSQKIHEICSTLGMGFYYVNSDIPIFDAFYEILKR